MENQDISNTVAFKSKEDGKVVILSRKELIDLMKDLEGLKKKIQPLVATKT